jgi:tetratricopeptide (TPR) repeat protein
MIRRLFGKTKQPRRIGAALGREFKVGDVIEQRYEIEKTRRGYMGIVYIAYDKQRRQYVVLKTFQNKFLWNEDAIARFNAEAELWMRIGSHPNIVHAYDLKTFMGKPHVIAEYVHGGPLRALIGHIETQEALDYAIQICWGMTYAVEQANILHRDLKPDNIMVTLDGQAKVTDFGLARVLPPLGQWHDREGGRRRLALRTAASADVLGGTLPYMAPELLDNSTFLGPWTDIYAFGVMLYEFFTGRLPFDSQRDESLIRMHISAPPPDPRALKPNIHAEAARIIQCCMAKRPTERYQSFREIEDDLQALRITLFGAHYAAVWVAQDDVERDRCLERGQAHIEMGEYAEALTWFRKAVALDSGSAECWLHLARARLKLWQYNEALEAADEGLRRAIRRDEFGRLYGVRGETFAGMLMLPRALESYDLGLSFTPNAPWLWREKGQLIQRMGSPRDAQRCYERALEYDKLDSLAWRLLGDALHKQERYKKAYDAYAATLKLDPRSAIAWSRYGVCQTALGRPKDALISFDAALKLDPDLDEAHVGLRAARQLLRS